MTGSNSVTGVVPFGQRLARAMDERGPLCVGIDPHPQLLRDWGLSDDAHGLGQFATTILQAVGPHVAAVKPQAALFERHGSKGILVLETVIEMARSLGVLTIVDAKRGDIGSTMAGYADAYLRDGSALAGDAVTLSPYLGFGSLAPAIAAAEESGRGVFVLCLTSNPEGAAVQHAVGSDGQSVAAAIARGARDVNLAALAGTAGVPTVSDLTRATNDTDLTTGGSSSAGQSPTDSAVQFGPVGLVVGATIGDAARTAGVDLSSVRGPLLAPGVGAQGAGAAELAEVFADARRSVLASSSRGVLQAGPDLNALRKAAIAASQEAAIALGR